MAERSHPNPYVARLRRLPAQFLLALINATVILALLAAVLALLAADRLDSAAERVSSAFEATVAARLPAAPGEVLQDLRSLRTELAAYRTGGPDPAIAAGLRARLEALDGRLHRLEDGVQTLVAAKLRLDEGTLREAGAALASAGARLLQCRLPEPPVPAAALSRPD